MNSASLQKKNMSETKMEKANYKKILSLLVAVLLVSAAITMLSMTATSTLAQIVPQQPLTTNALTTANWGNPDQENYSYPVGPGGTSGNVFSAQGPAPDTPNIAYTQTAANIGLNGSLTASPPIAFDNMLICYDATSQVPLNNGLSGASGTLVALNAQTGALDWYAPLYGAPRGFGTATFFEVKAASGDYIGEQASAAIEIYSAVNGARVGYLAFSAGNQTLNVPYDKEAGLYNPAYGNNLYGCTAFGGGSVIYWGGFYSSTDMMDFATFLATPFYYINPATGTNITTALHCAVAFDLSNPTNPQAAWSYVVPTGIEALCGAPGQGIFGGYGEGQIWAINDSTGLLDWTQFKQGNAGYLANYYDGLIYQSASSTCLSAWNATTGQPVFVQNQGAREFFVFGDSLYDNMYIGKNIAVPNGYIGAWDAQTGAPLWETPALYMIAYLTPVVADGKVYCERYDGTVNAAGVTQAAQFACLDAYTGSIIWVLNGVTWGFPIVAYGNLYNIAGGTVYCCGDGSSNQSPQPFTEFHYQTDAVNYGGVITGDAAPSTLAFAGQFGPVGPVSGSAVAANGMVYFGSEDGNIYAINAQNGAEIWNFTTGYRVTSTPCVIGNSLFTGGDDGNVYCLNALTGAQVWKTSVGGISQVFWVSAWQPRSSPQYYNGQIFVGSLDGNLYCINANSGSVAWKSAAGNETFPIGGTPLIISATNEVYIASSNSFLYAFNIANGTQMWATQVQGTTGFAIRSQIATPCYDRGFLWIGTGTIAVDRINATTGVIYNVIRLPYSAGSGTMTPALCAPAVWHSGTQYTLYIGDGFQEDAFNVTTFIYGNGVNSYNGTYYTIHGTTLNPGDSTNGGNANVAYTGTLMVNGSTGGTTTSFTGIYYFDKTLNRYVTANATTENNQQTNGTAGMLKPVVNETQAPYLWDQWLGHQIYSSSIYINDVQGPVIFVGDDVNSITQMNATNGVPISSYTSTGTIFCTPCLYNGSLYVGTQAGYEIIFRTPEPTSQFSIYGTSNKGTTMWNNETLTVAGRLNPTPFFYNTPNEPNTFGSYAANRLPNATITMEIVQPDNTTVALTATTDNNGFFTFNYNPTETGTYSWLVLFSGLDKGYIYYDPAYTQYTTIDVTAAPNNPTPTPVVSSTPTPISTATPAPSTSASASASLAPSSSTSSSKGISATDIYVIVAVIIIIVIAVAAYLFTRRGKKPAA